MNLKLFPLDTQTCHLTIASYGWTANDLIYTWKVRLETVDKIQYPTSKHGCNFLTIFIFSQTGLFKKDIIVNLF